MRVKFYVIDDTIAKDVNTTHRVYEHVVLYNPQETTSEASKVMLKDYLAKEENKANMNRAQATKNVRESEDFKKLRYELFDENKNQNGGKIICSYCHRECNRTHMHPHQATVDHLIPLSEGGDPFSRDNLVIACRKCNRAKRSQSVEKFTAKNKGRKSE